MYSTNTLYKTKGYYLWFYWDSTDLKKFHIDIYLGKYICLSCLPINPISTNLPTHLPIFTKWNWDQNTSLKWCVCKALEDYKNAHRYLEENEMKQTFSESWVVTS